MDVCYLLIFTGFFAWWGFWVFPTGRDEGPSEPAPPLHRRRARIRTADRELTA